MMMQAARVTIQACITKWVVTFNPNCNNVLPTHFVINYYKTGFYDQVDCNMPVYNVRIPHTIFLLSHSLLSQIIITETLKKLSAVSEE